MSQRLLVTIATVVLFFLGALVGTPGQYPSVNGTFLSPELLLSAIAPLLGVITMTWQLFGVISSRVAEGAIQPGDIAALFKMREFWVHLVAAFAGIFTFFNISLFGDEATQVVIVDVILGLVSLLFRDAQLRSLAQPLRVQSISVSYGTVYPNYVTRADVLHMIEEATGNSITAYKEAQR